MARALALYEQRRFDIEVYEDLHNKLDALLETLEIIASDDAVWTSRLADVSFTPEQRNMLSQLDPRSFALLLELAGYHHPPPPSANELSDDTIAELEMATGYPSVASLDRARKGLILTLMRIRRQVATQRRQTLTGESVLRSAARNAIIVAQKIIPKAVAAAASATVEAQTAGSGLGFAVDPIAKALIECGVEAGAEYLVTHLAVPEASDSDAARLSLEVAITEKITAHIGALNDLVRSDHPHSLLLRERRAVTAKASRHLTRIEELLEDYVQSPLIVHPLVRCWQGLSEWEEQFVAEQVTRGGVVVKYSEEAYQALISALGDVKRLLEPPKISE